MDCKLYTFCINCNKKIEQKNTGHKRKYCSDKCRYIYSNKNSKRDLYNLVCEYCGKEYEALSIKRKYCSDTCYIKNNYWRKEDVEEIMNKILAGEKLESRPKWLMELFNKNYE